MSFRMVSGIALAVAPVPVAAHAAEQPAGDATAAAADEIVVTAQKRSERLVDVPISISTIGNEAIAQNGLVTLEQLGQVVPGMRFDRGGAVLQPTIRGVGSQLTGPGLTPNVAIYVDGFYQANALATNFELADLENVQILKGPQGTLFGRNATGGAILVTTVKPESEPGTRGSVSYGRFDDLRAKVAITGGLGERLAGGISALYHRTDGFTRDIVTGEQAGAGESWAVRGKLLYEPSSDVSFLLIAEHSRTDDDATTALNLNEGRSALVSVPGVPILTERGEVFLNPGLHFFRNRTDNIYLKSTFDFGFAELTSYTGYQSTRSEQDFDLDGTGIGIFQIGYLQTGKTFTQEFNLASRQGGKFNWVAGLFYLHDNAGLPRFLGGGAAPLPLLYSGRIKADSFAAFGDATLEMQDSLFLTVGGRYSSEKSHRDFTPAGLPTFSADKTFSNFSPRAVLRYAVNRDASVYASFAQGFKAGGFNPSNLDPAFRPEKITAYELGAKAAGQGFHVEASAFYYTYRDLQITTYVGGSGVISNAASARVYGAELQAGLSPLAGLDLDLAAAWTDARYRRFPGAPTYTGSGAAGDPIVVTPVDASGKILGRAPELTFNASVSYEHALGGGRLRWFGSIYATSQFYFDAAASFRQEPYQLVNARLSYTLPGEAVTVSVFGNNLADERYLAQVLPIEGLAILQQHGEPRTYGVEVDFRF